MLIGSRALAFWLPEFRENIKPTTDWDVISKTTWPTLYQDSGIEWHKAGEYLSQEAVDQFATNAKVYIPALDYHAPVCSLSGLAAIKRSHLALDWNFDKHMTQYVRYLKAHLNPEDMDFVKRREKITLQKAKQKDMKLNVDKQRFFDDNIPKKFEHDYLHELVAFYDKPLYTRINADEQEVMCCKDKWACLSHQDKVRCVQEEAYVIALERWLIPQNFQGNYRGAYFKAVQKVCTTLTSGWFRDFAIDNWEAICDNYDKAVLTKAKGELL